VKLKKQIRAPDSTLWNFLPSANQDVTCLSWIEVSLPRSRVLVNDRYSESHPFSSVLLILFL